ncbi:carboxymuconolactone decarboxylase family protein [Aporhodopirellula aestuarii]|uniref:Carboxymuconolactone decarboxylase family protein n=1 Tax=Aporhodopirellula aestuarii TaxID=2950107 RepID=A0ABT0UBK1_9BACT|nr:carboxymuconolactone decarboxylase family protein [Aporhodopirellula aestuarii]MCM2374166.1 carboxymuconolactone decarboxylase family protein [Aporhodopirellula aestuarii]
MQRFPLIEEADAPPEVRQTFRDFQVGMGFPEVPNFIRIQGTSPGMVTGTWELAKNILLRGKLPRSTKELIFVAIAVDRECGYCRDAHTACCQMLGVENNIIWAVMKGLTEELPNPIREIIQFAIKCADGPHNLNQEDFARLRRQNLDSEQILEVIATAAMAIYSITIADATLLDTDEMFKAK